MDFKQLWQGLTKEQRKELASCCDTSVGHLSNIAYEQSTCSLDLAMQLEIHIAELYGVHQSVTRLDLIRDRERAFRCWPSLKAQAQAIDQASADGHGVAT